MWNAILGAPLELRRELLKISTPSWFIGRRYRKDGYRGAPPDAEEKLKEFRDEQVEAARRQSRAEETAASMEAARRERERWNAVRDMARQYRTRSIALKGLAVGGGGGGAVL